MPLRCFRRLLAYAALTLALLFFDFTEPRHTLEPTHAYYATRHCLRLRCCHSRRASGCRRCAFASVITPMHYCCHAFDVAADYAASAMMLLMLRHCCLFSPHDVSMMSY